MPVLGDKNKSTIRTYEAQTSLNKKRKMSETLSTSLNDNKPSKLAMIPLQEDEKSYTSIINEDITLLVSTIKTVAWNLSHRLPRGTRSQRTKFPAIFYGAIIYAYHADWLKNNFVIDILVLKNIYW